MIIVADDHKSNRDLLQRLLISDGHDVHVVPDGEAAFEIIERDPPDLVLTDVMMPRLDGLELCRRIKENRATRLIPVVLITGSTGHDDRMDGINAGADDFLTKPFNKHELRARVRSLMRLKQFTDELDSAESMIMSLAMTVEARDPFTGDHCQRMAASAAAFGAHLGLSNEDISALRRGGYLHDVGKVGVPDAVLLKAGRLTADEFDIMKSHTIIGDQLCGDLRLLRHVRPIVRHHHERLDGSGYPDGLCGPAIHLLAQIMGVVDVFDALTSTRPYRQPMTIEEACAELDREARMGWRDPSLIDEFIRMQQTGGLASL